MESLTDDFSFLFQLGLDDQDLTCVTTTNLIFHFKCQFGISYNLN